MKSALYILSLVFLVSCASTSQTTTSPRSLASEAGMTKLQWMGKTLATSTNSNCQISVAETSFSFGQGPTKVENIPALQVKVQGPTSKEILVTIVGEPEVTYAKYYSSQDKREKYIQTFKAYTSEDSHPDTPNKISVESSDDGTISKLVFNEARSALNGKPPEYSSYAPCQFKK